ncbi:MAG TPA: type II secretion system protein GspM [Actinomycetota bacterium]
MMTLNKRERSLIGAALLVGLGLIVYFYGVEPLQEWRRSGAEMIPSREAQLERRRLIVAQRPTLTAELERVNQQLLTRAPRWLQGPTPPLAASELQTLVKDVALKAGVEVRSERILPLAERSGLQEVPIEITVAGGLRETVRLLHDLEHTTKILTVQDVKVRVVAVGQPRDLLTTFNVSGYLLPSTPAPTAGSTASGAPKG